MSLFNQDNAQTYVIGASLGSFKELTVRHAMELYSNLSISFDLNAVEVRFEKEQGKPSLWYWEAGKEIYYFLKEFEYCGAHLPFIYLNPISLNQKIKNESIKQIKCAIEKASELGFNYTVMHARGIANGLTYEKQLEKWEKVIKELAECARDNSILLTLENADFLSNLKDLVNIIRKVDSKWLKLTLDVGHAHLRKVPPLSTYPIKEVLLRALDRTPLPFISKRSMPYEKYGSVGNFIKSEKDLISNVHIHDYNGKKDHISIGEGKINFSFLSILKNKFKGPYIFEIGFENHYEDFKKNYREFMGIMVK